MEGVVFQYEPPLLEVTDPVAAELAKALSTMESDHSSPSLVRCSMRTMQLTLRSCLVQMFYSVYQ